MADSACLAKAKKSRALERAFETSLSPELYDALAQEMEAGGHDG